jgi:MOSC domain-containing protein YiiM
MIETCAECGFDSRKWKTRDAVTLFHALHRLWWEPALAGISAADLNRRPAPEVWSALEYGVHSALVTAMIRWSIEQMVREEGLEFPAVHMADASAADASAALDPVAVLADLDREATAMAATASANHGEGWHNTATNGDGMTVSAKEALVHAAHDASHHFMDVSRGLAAIGAGTPAHAGSVAQVNASGGGVPKLPVGHGDIDIDGLVGDTQANRTHHGRPFQALSLWSAEVIDELAALGHPLWPGCAGENLTLTGLDWSAIRPGTRLRIGTALAEVSFPAVPCQKQTRWFSDGDFTRIAYEHNPQWVRWYAWVREPGEVRPGDEVLVQPR